MKSKVIILFSVLITNIVVAQDKFIGLNNVSMLYTIDTYLDVQIYQNLDYKSNEQNITNSSLSFSYSKIHKRILQELTLMPFRYDVSKYDVWVEENNIRTLVLNGANRIQIKSFLEYKCNYTLKPSDKTFVPFIGIGSMIFNQYENSAPAISNRFHKKADFLALYVHLNLGFRINISQKFNFNLQMPFMITESSYLWGKAEDPTVQEKLRSQDSMHHKWLPERYHLSIGVSYKLGKDE